MPRALAGAIGAMLAIAVGVSAPEAPAQVPAPQLQSPQTPVRKDCFPRLEEMKVELALLSDPTTFPFSVAASARDDALELYGFVPNAGMRQHILDVARRSTPLMVHDSMGIQPIPGLQPSPRLSSVLQKEGMELLQREMGETAKQVSLETRPNGVIVLNGRIDSFENKVKVSRLFRQLSGCGGVVNKLSVEPIVRNGRRVVRVTRDGSLCMPPSVLGLKEPAAPAPPPTLVLTNNPSSQKSQWNVPTTVPPKPPSTPIKPTPARTPSEPISAPIKPTPVPPRPISVPLTPPPAKITNAPDPYAPSKLPVKWGRPANGWETQVNELEALDKAHQQALMPTPVETAKRPPEPKKAVPLPTVAIKPSGAIASPRPNFAEVRPVPALAPDMTWRRSGGYEESEPKSPPPTRDVDASSNPLPSLRSARRWPPAYITGPPPSRGRPGVIVFDDDPPPAQPRSAAMAPPRPIVPADLQRRVKMLCGSEAREVLVATQRDGNVLVRVKVADRSIEDQLSRKILNLPEMTSPRVRLLMEVGP